MSSLSLISLKQSASLPMKAQRKHGRSGERGWRLPQRGRRQRGTQGRLRAPLRLLSHPGPVSPSRDKGYMRGSSVTGAHHQPHHSYRPARGTEVRLGQKPNLGLTTRYPLSRSPLLWAL